MYQKALIICLILSANILKAQNANSSNYSKIKFVYEMKPNMSFGESGIYMDTLMLKEKFPYHRFTRLKSPEDSTKIYGFVLYKNLTDKDKEIIKGIVVHHSEDLEGEYNKSKNKTEILSVRYGNKYFKAIEKYLNLQCGGSNSTHTFDFNKKICQVAYTQKRYTKKFSEIAREVTFEKDKATGVFSYNSNANIKGNVTFDKEMPTFIIPNLYFSNAIGGVTEYKTIYSTVTLKSVQYE